MLLLDLLHERLEDKGVLHRADGGAHAAAGAIVGRNLGVVDLERTVRGIRINTFWYENYYVRIRERKKKKEKKKKILMISRIKFCVNPNGKL